MSPVAAARGTIQALRRLDTLVSRYRDPDTRDILLDARTSMEYAMMAPVHEALARDPRVRVWLTSSERPQPRGRDLPGRQGGRALASRQSGR